MQIFEEFISAPTEHYSPTESMMNNNVFATFKDNFLLSPYKSHLNSALLILIVFAWITLTSLDLQNVHIIMKIWKFSTQLHKSSWTALKKCLCMESLKRLAKRYAQSPILYIK